jgi:hypothetical protein
MSDTQVLKAYRILVLFLLLLLVFTSGLVGACITLLMFLSYI